MNRKKRSIKLNDNRVIGDFQKPYIVAELNTSHFGNISIAKKMILTLIWASDIWRSLTIGINLTLRF